MQRSSTLDRRPVEQARLIEGGASSIIWNLIGCTVICRQAMWHPAQQIGGLRASGEAGRAKVSDALSWPKELPKNQRVCVCTCLFLRLPVLWVVEKGKLKGTFCGPFLRQTHVVSKWVCVLFPGCDDWKEGSPNRALLLGDERGIAVGLGSVIRRKKNTTILW